MSPGEINPDGLDDRESVSSSVNAVKQLEIIEKVKSNMEQNGLLNEIFNSIKTLCIEEATEHEEPRVKGNSLSNIS